MFKKEKKFINHMLLIMMLIILLFLFDSRITYKKFLNNTESVINSEINVDDNGKDKYIALKYLGIYKFSIPAEINCRVSQIKRFGADNISQLIEANDLHKVYILDQAKPAPSFLNCTGISKSTKVIIYQIQ